MQYLPCANVHCDPDCFRIMEAWLLDLSSQTENKSTLDWICLKCLWECKGKLVRKPFVQCHYKLQENGSHIGI